MEGPAAAAEHDLPAEHVSGARNHRAQAQTGAGLVEEGRVPQEPQAVSGGDPVVAVVLGVAVAGDDGALRGEDFVHPGDIVGGQKIVGVEDKVAVIVMIAPLLADMGEEEVQGVALAHMAGVTALVDDRARVTGRLGGVVGAVVGDHVDVQVFGGVVLPLEAVHQLGDHRLLVPGGDQHGVAAQGGVPRDPVPAPQGHRYIQKLIEVTRQEQDADHPVHIFQNHQCAHDLLLSRV